MVKNNYKDWDWASIYKEYLSGLSMSKLAKKYNTSKVMIRNYFNKLGYKIRSRKEAHFLCRGENAYNWIGGRSIMGHGYIQLRLNGKTILEHNHVYCCHNNLKNIPKGYVIHHLDNDKSNNKIENLKLMTKFAHRSLHSKEFVQKNGRYFGINQEVI